MKQMIDLSEKKILVTGASRGIGKAVAILLSQVGAQVVLVARNKEKLEETISKMDTPDRHFYLTADLFQTEQIRDFMKECIEKDGVKLSGLVHCAGISTTIPLSQISYEKLDREMRINYYAFIEMVKYLAKRNYHTKECSIVGISSVSALRGAKCQTMYSATKAAMDASVITLAKELADKEMRINSIRPGTTKTEMLEEWAKQKGVDLDTFANYQPLGMGLPEDIADLAAFLLSPAARMITGQNISVDGGM